MGYLRCKFFVPICCTLFQSYLLRTFGFVHQREKADDFSYDYEIVDSPRLFRILRYTREHEIHTVNLEHDSLETLSLLICNADYLRK